MTSGSYRFTYPDILKGERNASFLRRKSQAAS